MTGNNAPLCRRGAVKRRQGGEASVIFAVNGCAGCGRGGGSLKELPVRTDLPEGTVVEVQVQPRRLLGQAARVFAPPLAAALGAAAVFGNAGWAATLGLLVGVFAAVAAGRLCRDRASAGVALGGAHFALRPVDDPAVN